MATILPRFDYALRGKPDKGLLRRFLSKATGLSRAQVQRQLLWPLGDNYFGRFGSTWIAINSSQRRMNPTACRALRVADARRVAGGASLSLFRRKYLT